MSSALVCLVPCTGDNVLLSLQSYFCHAVISRLQVRDVGRAYHMYGCD